MTLVPKYLKDFPEVVLPVKDTDSLAISPATEQEPDSYRIAAADLANYVNAQFENAPTTDVVATGLKGLNFLTNNYIRPIFSEVLYNRGGIWNNTAATVNFNKAGIYRFDLQVTIYTVSLTAGDHFYFVLYYPPFDLLSVDVITAESNTYPAIMSGGEHTFNFSLTADMPALTDIGVALLSQAEIAQVSLWGWHSEMLTITYLSPFLIKE